MTDPRKSELRRRLKSSPPILPCRWCGALPELDLGLLDAMHPEGQELVACHTIYFQPSAQHPAWVPDDQAQSADPPPGWSDHPPEIHTGIAAWNMAQAEARGP